MRNGTVIRATKPIRVFVDAKIYGHSGTEILEKTQLRKLPKDRIENLSWKGCYYTIQPNETVTFDRSNNWDYSYFMLDNGVEIRIDCGNPLNWISRNEFEIL